MIGKAFIKTGVFMAAILGVVFASQMPYFKDKIKNVNIPLLKKGEAYANESYLSQASDWLKNDLYGKFNGEVAKRGDLVTAELSTQKNNATASAVGGVKKIVAEKFLQTLGIKPEDLVTPVLCPTPTSSN